MLVFKPVGLILIFAFWFSESADPLLKPKLLSDGYEEKDWIIHDPSRVNVIKNGTKHMIATTGKGLEGGHDCGLETYWRNANGNGDWRPG